MAERLTFSEYFAGIGLVRLGLEQQGWRVVFANDIDPRKYEMFSHFFGDDEHDPCLFVSFRVPPCFLQESH